MPTSQPYPSVFPAVFPPKFSIISECLGEYLMSYIRKPHHHEWSTMVGVTVRLLLLDGSEWLKSDFSGGSLFVVFMD